MSPIIKGRIFNIQHFSLHDGPGIRTTVFLKGCPLRCVWCHNPESWKIESELSYNKDKCSGCGACAKVCENNAHIFNGTHEIDRSKCTVCGKCAEVCYYNSLEIIGKDYTVDEVIADVMRDKIFYETSNGGITLSGGEPMYQFDFTFELVKKSKENDLHVCIETSGFTSVERILKVSEFVDIFLFDYKVDNPKYTGADNKIILNNLAALDKNGSQIILRCPIIPDINDNSEHYKSIADIANKYDNITEINIQPYHPLGISKNRNIGRDSNYTYESFFDKNITAEISSMTNKNKKVIQM